MPLTVKNWQDYPSTATPISAVALEDMETRLAAYTEAPTSVVSHAINFTSAPTTMTTNAAVKFSQTRSGVPSGDPMWVINDVSMADPYKAQVYFTDSGHMSTGRAILCSQKRFNALGGVPANGSMIQGVSSVSDGSEPSMIAASVDIDGPAFAGEASIANTAGKKNQSAFAAYDLDDISGGGGAYSPGYGRKKFVIRGDGGLWWGSDLQKDNWANVLVKLYRNASTVNTLRTDSPFTVATYTTATKPAAANVPGGTIIFVSDGGAGAVFQGSTGAAWVNLG